MLTRDRVLELLEYNPATGEFRRKVPRGGEPAGSVAGYVGGSGYILISIDGKRYHAHRLAWLIVTGAWPRGDIDHINGIRTDNRIENLRDVTRSVNMQNLKRAHIDSTTGVLGILKVGKRYRARLMVNYTAYHIGYFDTAAYLAAKRQYHEGNTL